jgi:hypothetical protein
MLGRDPISQADYLPAIPCWLALLTCGIAEPQHEYAGDAVGTGSINQLQGGEPRLDVLGRGFFITAGAEYCETLMPRPVSGNSRAPLNSEPYRESDLPL